ncbi:MAG: N-acetylmuramoyl-L-alanine amidase [Arenimonas sp.]
MRNLASSRNLCKTGLLLLLAPVFANATQLQDLKLLAMDGQTQAELSLSDKSSYKVFTLSKPERLVLDLPATATSSSFKLPGANGVISKVRTGQPTPGTLRVVFDLSETVQTKSRIEGTGANTRLVIELINPNAKPASISHVAAKTAPVKVSESQAPENKAPENKVADIKAAMQEVLSLEAKPEIKPAAIETKEIEQADVKVDNKSSARFPATKTLQSVFGNSQRELIIAIDAGHGGKDPGAIGPSGVREKNITLATARELAKQINAEPGMKAFLVRNDDSFVVLQDRYMRARKAQADLFISIHADAALNGAANGSSVFVLSLKGASSQAARWLADKENAADLVGGVSLDAKDKNLAAVLLDLSQSATMRVSEDVADEVLGSLKDLGKAHKPNVEHANFVVLRSPDVPSMLIETGFITNPNEERKLSDPAHRERLASAVVSGIRDYFSEQAPPGTWFAAQQERRDDNSRGLQYVVSRGETLSQIATRHGVPMGTILLANNKRNDDVRVGERLIIPLASTPK